MTGGGLGGAANSKWRHGGGVGGDGKAVVSSAVVVTGGCLAAMVVLWLAVAGWGAAAPASPTVSTLTHAAMTGHVGEGGGSERLVPGLRPAAGAVGATGAAAGTVAAQLAQLRDDVAALTSAFNQYTTAALSKAEAEGAALQHLATAMGVTAARSALATEAAAQGADATGGGLVGTGGGVAGVGGRYAIIGLAKGFDLAFSYRFVRSARQSGMSAHAVDIILFTDDVSGDRGWLYEAYGVTVVQFQVELLPPTYRNYHPSSYRWILIRDWMASLPAERQYTAVLFADVRDTVFQGDPFAHIKAPGFYAFLEAKPRTIRECGWNAGWVRDCFGEAGLTAVGGNVISCSGTSMATWAAGMAYVNLLAEELLRNRCERNGVDQGMHNYFVFHGDLAKSSPHPVHLITNEEGWIATVQSMPTLQRDKVGRVLNAMGAPVALVHQYDRSDALKEQYAREFTWLESEAERTRK